MFVKLRTVITLVLAGMLMISCQKELSLDATTAGGTAAPCKSCSYIPWCNGSVYTYVDTTMGTGTTSITTLTIIKDTTIDGKIFQKFANPGADGYYNCTDGVSTLIAYNVPSSGGPVIKVEQTELKANEGAGATWSNSMNNGLGQNVDYNYKIAGKGLSKTVLGVDYTNVIQVHLTISMTAPVIGTLVVGEADYYYANNVGLIDNVIYTTNPFGGPPTVALHRVLKTYSIP